MQSDDKLNLFISRYILTLGFFFFLTGVLLFSSFSAYHTQVYLFLIVPALVLLIRDWKSYIPILSSGAFKVLLALFAYVAMSLFWNDPAIIDFKYLKRLFIILLFIIALLSIAKRDENEIVRILLAAAVIYAIAACYSFINEYIVQGHILSWRIIGAGNLSNPLLSSHFYGVFSAFLIAYFFSIKRNWKKDIVLGVLFFCMMTFVLLTGSRTPLLGLGAVLAVLLLMHRSKHLLFFFFASCGLAVVYLILNFDLLVLRGLSYRPEIWSITFEKLELKPLFGYGFGTGIHIESEQLKRIFVDTHSIHVGFAYHFGLFGFIIWLGFLLSLVKIYLNNKASFIAQLGIVLLTYGVFAGLTEGTSIITRPKEVWFLIWLPVALLFAAEFIQIRATAADKEQCCY